MIEGSQSLVPRLGDTSISVCGVSHDLSFAALMVGRGMLALEASAVVTTLGALVIVGGPASGKSALALAFSMSGYGLLADGVVAIDCLGEAPTYVLPIPGTIVVSQDVLDAVALLPERVHRVRDGVPRFAVSDIVWAQDQAPLFAVCLLGRSHLDAPQVTRVAGRSRVLAVIRHSYNRFLSGSPDARQRTLMTAAKALQSSLVFSLRLPESALQPAATVRIIREACGFE